MGIKKSWKTERKVRVNQDHKSRVESQSGFVSKWRRLTSSQFCHCTVLPFFHLTVLPFWHFAAFLHFTVLQFSFLPLTSRYLNVPVKMFFVLAVSSNFCFRLKKLFLLSSQKCKVLSSHLGRIPVSCKIYLPSPPKHEWSHIGAGLNSIGTSTQFYCLKNITEEGY